MSDNSEKKALIRGRFNFFCLLLRTSTSKMVRNFLNTKSRHCLIDYIDRHDAKHASIKPLDYWKVESSANTWCYVYVWDIMSST